MKHNSSNRRSRSRGSKQRHSGGRNNHESNGPGGKVRGTAQQVLDKYLALARDAQSSGDRIGAESFFQFAEHYFRVLNVEGSNGQVRRDRTSEVPGDLSVPSFEENHLDPAAQDVRENENESSGVEGNSTNDPADQPQPEMGTGMSESSPSVADVQRGDKLDEGSTPDRLHSKSTEDEQSEDVDAPTAS